MCDTSVWNDALRILKSSHSLVNTYNPDLILAFSGNENRSLDWALQQKITWDNETYFARTKVKMTQTLTPQARNTCSWDNVGLYRRYLWGFGLLDGARSISLASWKKIKKADLKKISRSSCSSFVTADCNKHKLTWRHLGQIFVGDYSEGFRFLVFLVSQSKITQTLPCIPNHVTSTWRYVD